jgi:secreted trypsin-like serine protease
MIRIIMEVIKENKIKLLTVLVLIGMLLNIKTDKWIQGRTVQLTNGHGSCSGEQVTAPSGSTYILTAAHCLSIKDDNDTMLVTLENGDQLRRRVIAEDPKSDLLLLEGVPNMSGLKIASSIKRQEHVNTFTHGFAFKTYKTEGQIIDERMSVVQVNDILCTSNMPKYKKMSVPTIFGMMDLCAMATIDSVTTAMTVPGSSGGMVVNDSGELVGVVSAGDGAFGYLVTLSDIKNFIKGY